MMKKNVFLKILLFAQAIFVFVYTLFVYQNEGSDLFSVFIDNVRSINWSGQFNLDFMSYLILSGLWIMWREHFTIKSIIIGFLAMVLGIVFFAPYVLYLLTKEEGDFKKVLLGRH